MSITETPAEEGQIAFSSLAPRPSRFRYVLACMLTIVGLSAVVTWGWRAEDGVYSRLEELPGAPVPGVYTVDAHPGTYTVYQGACCGATSVRVTDPSGREVPIRSATDPRYFFIYDPWKAVARFDVPVGGMGSYRVEMTGDAEGRFAVSEFDAAGWLRPQRLTMGALLLVNVGVSIVIVVVPIVQWRRRRTG